MFASLLLACVLTPDDTAAPDTAAYEPVCESSEGVAYVAPTLPNVMLAERRDARDPLRAAPGSVGSTALAAATRAGRWSLSTCRRSRPAASGWCPSTASAWGTPT